MEKLILIDGHSILNRAYYGVPDLTNSQGLHTNAVYGFLNILFKILEEEQASYLAVAFDLKEPTFRHKMYEAYKGTRKPMPQELVEQVPLMKEVLASMGVPILTLAGYEADDVLGTVAKRCQKEGLEVSVVSGDRDLLQLADDHIKIRIPKTSKGKTEVYDYYPQDVKAQYGVTPLEFIDMKALMGDASDNIPGVPSIGEKTAAAIIEAYHSIENAYEHLDEIKPPRAQKALREHFDLAKLSKELAAICTDCPVEFDLEQGRIGDLYTEEAYEQMKRLGFKSLLGKFENQRGAARSASQPSGRRILDPKEWEACCEKAAKGSRVGLALAAAFQPEQMSLFDLGLKTGDGPETEAGLGAGLPPRASETAALALCLEDGETVWIARDSNMPGEWLSAKASQLIKAFEGRDQAAVWVMDLKEILPFLNIPDDGPVYDGGVAAYLLNPLKDGYGYDDLAADYLGMTLPGRTELLGKADFGKELLAGNEKAGEVLSLMAFTALNTSRILEEELENTGMAQLYRQIEMPLIYSLFHMEQAGVRVERAALKDYGSRLKVQIDQVEAEIYEGTGKRFNINSPKQLGEILFGEMKLPGGKKTKTGYSTAADVLEKLADDHPVVRKILDYRQLTKLYSTYAEGLAAYIGPDGRIHGKFNQTITATGRISSTEPNLQNIPVRMELGREIRKVFVPAEGCVFIDADYSQIELRILAHMSGDERLIEAYRSAQDIHAITASQVFHTPLDQVTPLQRRNAKAVNFGIVYGISAFGLSEDLSISRKEAMEYIDQYFHTYPGVKTFLDDLVRQGKEQGYVTTLYGRRRPIPELKSSNFMQRQFGERVAMNSPIQGTAADIMKIAMIRADRRLREEGFKARIVLQIHDELLVEAPVKEAEQVKALLEEEMRGAAQLKVALEVEAKTGDSWFAAK